MTKAARYPKAQPAKPVRVVVLMHEDEVSAVDAWAIPYGMPNRTSAIRALLRKGLEAMNARPPGGAAAAGQASQA